MPSHYKFYCEECRWKGSRYRNLKICPRCGAPVHREIDGVVCYHGTSEVALGKILQVGFKPDSWFARHIEDALAVGGNIIIAVQFEKERLPQSWQFHILEAIPVSSIKGIYEIKEIAPKHYKEKPPNKDTEKIYPCDICGKLRSKDEGGTTFTVCDECWNKIYPKPKPPFSVGFVDE